MVLAEFLYITTIYNRMTDDPTKPTDALQDYWNTYFSFSCRVETRSDKTVKGIRKCLKNQPVKTVDEYYQYITSTKKNNFPAQFKTDMERFSKRVERLSELAQEFNRARTKKRWNKICVEVDKLIFGSDHTSKPMF